MIKGRIQVGVVDPRIGESGAVGVGQRELSASPEVLVEGIIQNLEETGVYIGEEVLLTPFQAIGMCAGGVGRMESRLLLTGAPIPIILLVRTPMKSASDNVVSAGRVSVIVAS